MIPFARPIKRFFRDLMHLVFPNLCYVCETYLVDGEYLLCLDCIQKMPQTRYWNMNDNPVERIFLGRVPIQHACSLFFYTKTSAYRNLIYALKYHNQPQIGFHLGVRLGHKLLTSPYYQDIDYLLPLPLHAKRQRQRGYNQADFIAQGIASVMGIPINRDVVKRIKHKSTQTQKGRIDRWSNMENVFHCQPKQDYTNKHFLLIDDVITTGATLDACSQALLEAVDCKISIVSLGFASN